MFLLAPLRFFAGQTTLKKLAFCISCQFRYRASLPVSQLSSSVSFLCCTGAEHYVNLVIGTGPSPLYGFLSSRSTWLVKEDGMKINEVQLIQERGGGPLQHFHWGDSTDQQQQAPSSAVSLQDFFFFIACFNPWTLDLPLVLQSHHWLDWCRYISQSFPFELKGPALQNRFSSTIHTDCQ